MRWYTEETEMHNGSVLPFFSPLKTRSDAKSWLLLRRIQDACESCLINWCHSFFFCMNTFTLKSCLSRCSCLINTVSVFRKRSLATDVRVCRMPGLRLLVCRVFCCMPVLLLFHTAKKKKVCIDPMVCIVLEAVVNGIRNTVNTGTHPFTWAWQRYMICLMCWL